MYVCKKNHIIKFKFKFKADERLGLSFLRYVLRHALWVFSSFLLVICEEYSGVSVRFGLVVGELELDWIVIFIDAWLGRRCTVVFVFIVVCM